MTPNFLQKLKADWPEGNKWSTHLMRGGLLLLLTFFAGNAQIFGQCTALIGGGLSSTDTVNLEVSLESGDSIICAQIVGPVLGITPTGSADCDTLVFQTSSGDFYPCIAVNCSMVGQDSFVQIHAAQDSAGVGLSSGFLVVRIQVVDNNAPDISCPSCAPRLIFEEGGNDLSGDLNNPTRLAIGPGVSDTLRGSVNANDDQFDYFTFTIPVGKTLDSLTLSDFTAPGGALSRFEVFDVASSSLGGFNFNAGDVGDDLLDLSGVGALSPGTYTIMFREINENPDHNYEVVFHFDVECDFNTTDSCYAEIPFCLPSFADNCGDLDSMVITFANGANAPAQLPGAINLGGATLAAFLANPDDVKYYSSATNCEAQTVVNIPIYDIAGNTANCSYEVNVIDTIAPELDVNATSTAFSGGVASLPDTVWMNDTLCVFYDCQDVNLTSDTTFLFGGGFTPVGMDNCMGTVTAMMIDEDRGAVSCGTKNGREKIIYEAYSSWVFQDICDSVSTDTFLLYVGIRDTSAPALTKTPSPTNTTINTMTTLGMDSIYNEGDTVRFFTSGTYATVDTACKVTITDDTLSIVYDDCQDTTVFWQVTSGAYVDSTGDGADIVDSIAMWPVGVHDIKYSGVDPCGNISVFEFTLEVIDNTPPALANCPGDREVVTVGGNCVSPLVTWTSPTSADSCALDTFIRQIIDPIGQLDVIQTIPQDSPAVQGAVLQANFPLGVSTVRYIAVDIYGNADSCSFTVTVKDTLDPIAMGQSLTRTVNASGNLIIGASAFDDGSTDNCGNPLIYKIARESEMVFQSQDTFDCTFVDSTINMLFAVCDTSGNGDTVMVTLTVVDSIAPDVQCVPNTVMLNASGLALVTPDSVDGGTTDNCNLDSLWVDPASFNCNDIGTNSVTLYARDASGNESSCNATVTVEDNIDPVANCFSGPIDLYLDAGGDASITVSDVDSASFDNCSFNTSIDVTDFGCNDIGSNTVILTVEETQGDQSLSTCSVTVNVIDTVDPSAMCQPATVQVDGDGRGVLNAADVNNGSSDACGIASLVLSDTSFNCANVGETNIVTLTVTDVNNNSSTCTAVITVEDNINPTAICKKDTVSLGASGSVTITPANINGGSFDNCDSVNLAIAGSSTFSCGNVGPNVVTLLVNDPNGNNASCSDTLFVVDDMAPMAQCNDITVALNAAGTKTLNNNDISLIGNGSTDNCGIDSFSVDPRTFTCDDLGLANIVILTVTDLNGNTSTCTATVSVIENQPPTAKCRQDTIPLTLDGTGNVSITPALVDAGSEDLCGGPVTLNLSDTQFGCDDAGDIITVTLFVTDTTGLQSTCTAEVAIEDPFDPFVTCLAVTAQLDSSGKATVNGFEFEANSGGTGPCQTIIQRLYRLTDSSVAGTGLDTFAMQHTFMCDDQLGTYAVEYKVVTSSGKEASCMTQLTLEDNIFPQAIAKDTVMLILDGNGEESITAIEFDNGSNDNCGFDLAIARASVGSYSTSLDFNCMDTKEMVDGGIQVVLRVTDSSNNITYDTGVVIIKDEEAPEVVCATGYIINSLTAPAENVFNGDVAMVTDVEGQNGATTFRGTAIGNSCADTFFPSGILCDEGMGMDDPLLSTRSNVNAGPLWANPNPDSSCGFLVVDMKKMFEINRATVFQMFSDSAAKVTNVKAYRYVGGGSNPTPFPNSEWEEIIGFDGSVGAGNLNGNAVTAPADFMFSPVQTRYVLLAFKNAGNEPYIGVRGVKVFTSVINTDQDSCFELNTAPETCVAPLNWVAPQVSDNCSPDTFRVTITNMTTGMDTSWMIAGGDTLMYDFADTSKVAYYVADKAGNADSCHFKVIVNDDEAPQIACMQDTTIFTTDSTCNKELIYMHASAIDNCDDEVQIDQYFGTLGSTGLTVASGGLDTMIFQLGETDIFYVATDNFGNTDTCGFTVTVEDNVAPVVKNCPPDTVLSTPGPAICSREYFWLPPSAMDNCSDSSFLNNLANVEIFTSNPNVPISVNNVLPGKTGSFDRAIFPSGLTTVFYIFMDESGNTDTCQFDVLVIDPLVCPADQQISTCPEATVPDYVADFSQNCPGPEVTQIPEPGQTLADLDAKGLINGGISNGSTFTVTFIKPLADGTFDTCDFVVTLTAGLDTESPMILCPANIMNYPTDSALCTATNIPGIRVTPGEIDNLMPGEYADACSDSADIAISYRLSGATTVAEQPGDNAGGETYNQGVTVVTFYARDLAGNVDSCSMTVEVKDQEAPVILSTIADTLFMDCDSVMMAAELEVTDNCTPTDSIDIAFTEVFADTSANCPSNYVIYRDWVVTDSCGNSTSASQVVIVTDEEGPVFAPMADTMTFDNDPDLCSANLSIEVNATDACSDTVQYFHTVQFADGKDTSGIGNVANYIYPVGISVITWSAEDNCGNVSSKVSVIEVLDVDIPVLGCINSVVFPLKADGTFTLQPQNVVQVLDDNCTDPADIELELSQSFFECGVDPIGTPISISITATDEAGNETVCNTMVTFQENLPPTAVCQDITVQLDFDGQAQIDPAQLNGGSSDSCTDPDSLDFSAQSQFDCGDIGDNDVILTVADGSGNTANCLATVTVEDNVAPVANCDSVIIYLNEQGVAFAIAEAFDNGSFDNCTDSTELNFQINGLDTITFDCNQIGGPKTILFTATDEYNNTDTCFTQLFLVDTLPAVAVCEDITVNLDSNGMAMIDAVELDGGSEDVCDSTDLFFFVDGNEQVIFDCENLGTKPVVLTVEDGNGNTDTCISNVTVMPEDTIELIMGDGAAPFGDTACVPIVVNNFNFVLGFQFSGVVGNDSIAQLVDVELAPGLDSLSSLNLSSVFGDTFSLVATFDENVSLADGDTIAFVKTLMVGPSAATTTITLDPQIVPEVEVTIGCNFNIVSTPYILDPEGIVEVDSNTTAVISGFIETIEGNPVCMTTVFLSGDEQDTVMTDVDGYYEFLVKRGSDVMVTPKRNKRSRNGLGIFEPTVQDAANIQIAIASGNPGAVFNSGFKWLAANPLKTDGNAVTVGDALSVVQLVVGVLPEYPQTDFWEFVDADYPEPPLSNPIAPFPASISFTDIQMDQPETDFIGFAMGDVSSAPNSFAVPTCTDDDSQTSLLDDHLTIVAYDQPLVKGETFTLQLRARDFADLNAMQFTLNFDPSALSFTEVDYGSLPNLNESCFGLTMLNEGLITFGWYETQGVYLADDDILFGITFTAESSLNSLANVFDITSDYTGAVAFPVKEAPMGVQLLVETVTNTQNVDGDRFELFQNQPNPFIGTTVIGFTLPQANQARLNIYDVTGKLVFTQEGQFAKGYNQVTIEKADLPQQGVYTYELVSETHRAAKQMILID